MSHELFGERFASYRQPAWHGLGRIFDDTITAEDAFDAIGHYDVTLVDLTTADGTPIPYKAVVRSATDDDPEEVVFGVVNQDYGLITPRDFVQAWDKEVGAPIETIGAIKRGETMFITTKMPVAKLDIMGDAIDMYLIAVSPMGGNKVARVQVAPIRVVCQNTLVMSDSIATEQYHIRHDKDAVQNLGEWMHDLYARTQERVNLIENAFGTLANHRVTKDELKTIVHKAYPVRRMPKSNAPEHIMKQRMEWWEIDREATLRRRAWAVENFTEGRGMGMQSQATTGTAWGVYNAVVEVEDYRPGRHDESRQENSLFGNRAAPKARAFAASLDVVGFEIPKN